MRQGHVGQADALMRSLAKGRFNAVRPTNDQGQVTATKLPIGEACRQGLGREVAPTLVQHHNARTFRDGGLYACALRGVQRIEFFRTTRFGLDRLELDLEFVGKALCVIVPRRLCPIGHPQSHGNNHQPHGIAQSTIRRNGEQASWGTLSWQVPFWRRILPPFSPLASPLPSPLPSPAHSPQQFCGVLV